MRLHPTRPTLLAYDAGELSSHRTRRVAGHLAGCVRCRRSLVRRREQRAAVAEMTSPPAPAVLAGIRARIDAGESLLLPDPDLAGAREQGQGRRVVGAAAVALLVALGSAAAAAGLVDVRPLARWVGLGESTGESLTPDPADVVVSGVEVEVPPSGLRVVLEEVGDPLVLVVGWTERRLLEVIGRGAASEAGFRVGSEQVTVRGAVAGELRLGVPRSVAGTVRVVMGPRVVAVVQGDRVRFRGREPAREARATVGELRAGEASR